MVDSCQFISLVRYILNFQAVLGYDKMKTGKMFYLCGASIINKKYVLTAAHCHNKKRRDSKIRYYYNKFYIYKYLCDLRVQCGDKTINMTRAIGDLNLRKYGIISEPR